MEGTIPKFKKCILHIGTEKTGTTTLQAFLGENRRALMKQGFFVSASLSPYPVLANHERLTTFALRDEKVADDLRVAAGVRTVDEVAKHRADVLAKLRAEVADRDSSETTLLLSNEHCHSRLLEPEEVSRLHGMLCEFVDEFQVVIYLRPQHELATSLYDQALKAGYFDIDVLPFSDPNKRQWVVRKYFQYDDLIQRWVGAFGRQSIVPRLFQRGSLRDQNIIADFADLIGVSTDQLKSVNDRNRSIGRSFQQALNAINRYGAAHPGSITPDVRARIIQFFTLATPEPGVKPTRQAAVDFLKQFESGNEYVRKEFFPERSSLFDVDFASFPEEQSAQLLDREVLVKAMLQILKQ